MDFWKKLGKLGKLGKLNKYDIYMNIYNRYIIDIYSQVLKFL